MKEQILLGVGSSLFGMAVFTVAMHIHFPSDAIVERARWEVQNGSDGAYALEASGARWWMPGGVTLSDATLLSVDQKRRSRDAEDGTTASPLFRADSASIRLALLPLLQGTRIVQYAAEVYGGEISGQFGESATHRLITIQTDGLDLARIPIEGEDWSVDATGMLRIEADLAIATEKGKKAPDSDGSILIEIDDFVVKNSTMMGMDLVAAEFQEAVLELSMKGKKAEVERGRFESDLIDLTLDGYMNMASSDPDRWRLRLELTFTLGESLDTMASMLPNLKRARGEDGTYHMMCTGTVSNPVCREDRSKVRGQNPRSKRAEGGFGVASPDDGDSKRTRRDRRSKDADSRREDRRQRLEERRARLREDRPVPRPDERFEDGPDIEIDREFDGPRGRPLPFDGEEDDGRPPPPEFEDDFPPPDQDFDDQMDPGEDLPEIGYIDE
jgi:type II secretion system protein N